MTVGCAFNKNSARPITTEIASELMLQLIKVALLTPLIHEIMVATGGTPDLNGAETIPLPTGHSRIYAHDTCEIAAGRYCEGRETILRNRTKRATIGVLLVKHFEIRIVRVDLYVVEICWVERVWPEQFALPPAPAAVFRVIG